MRKVLLLTRKSSSSLSDERSSLSLVELEVVEAVEAIPATDGFLPPGVANPPPHRRSPVEKGHKGVLDADAVVLTAFTFSLADDERTEIIFSVFVEMGRVNNECT